MMAFIELTQSALSSAMRYQEIDINIGLAPAVAAGDVIFDENAAYHVERIFHFPDRSVPVVTKQKLSLYKFE